MDATTSAAPHPALSAAAAATSPSRPWTLALTASASFLAALDTMVVNTALPTIGHDLHASLQALEWVVNAYTLSFAVLLMAGAALGDRFGRKRMFIAGLGIFAAASAACALAPGAGTLVAARVLQGVGAALVMPLAMALLGAAYPREVRAKALGIYGGITGLAVFAGPVVGGAIAQSGAWQGIFWLNLPLALVLMALAGARLRESHGPQAPLDLGGMVLATGGALGLVWGLVRADVAGWGRAEVVGALLAGAVSGALFLAWQARSRAPMMPLRLFRANAFAAGNAAAFMFSAALYGTLFFLAQFLQIAQGQGPLGAGLRLLPWTATLFVMAPLAGAMVNRVGEKPLVVAGLLLQSAGLAWIAAIATPDLPYARLVLPLIITGAGLSAAMPAAQNAVFGAVAPPEIGKASGIYNMLRFLGGVFGVAVLAAVFAAGGGLHSAAEFGRGFVPAMAVAALFAFIGACAGLGLPGRAPRAVPAGIEMRKGASS
jgi:EmrB/QacA subfamily drug resistance transporter